MCLYMYFGEENNASSSVLRRKTAILILMGGFSVTPLLWILSAGQVAALGCSWGVRGEFCSQACPGAPGGRAWISCNVQPAWNRGYFPALQRCQDTWWVPAEHFPLSEWEKVHVLYVELVNFFFFFLVPILQDLLHTRTENSSLEINTLIVAINLHHHHPEPPGGGFKSHCF